MLLFFYEAKSSCEDCMEDTEQMWYSTGNCKRGGRPKVIGYYFRTFHRTAMLFPTSWSFFSREITKSFKTKILETEFHNPVEYGKAQAQKWHGYCGSVVVLLVISASGNCSSPFLCVASFSASVLCTKLSLYCLLINESWFYPKNVHLNRLEVCNGSLR